jgi:acetyltransferase-like isoleucine patch superfamily enzyme
MKMIASTVSLGENVTICEFVNMYGCRIGDNTKIGPFVEIQKGAIIGKNCKISSHSFICEGVTIGDNVFVGHNVTFVNDKYPRATTEAGQLKGDDDWACLQTEVQNGASIGSSATILCGVTIGENTIVGAGSVVTKSIQKNEVVAGNPARTIRSAKDTLKAYDGKGGDI